MIAKRIKELRTAYNMTQKELSNRLGLTPKMVSFYELGHRNPPNDIILKLATIFNVSTDYLLGLDEERKVMLSEKMKALRKQKGISQAELAKHMNVTQQAVGKWEKDITFPNMETLKKVAAFFNVSTDYLLGCVDHLVSPEASDSVQRLLDHDSPRNRQVVKIPVLRNIVAGEPISAVEDIIDYEEIPKSMTRSGEYYALIVRGHSMEPKFLEGDIVIVRKKSSVDSGRIAVVLMNGEDATLKKVQLSSDGIMLIGYNVSAYEPRFYSNKEIIDLQIQIMGEVVQLRRNI